MTQPDRRTCPGCGTPGVPRTKLACKPCWFRLPRPLRREVDAAYRVRSRDPRRHLIAVGAASLWWRANPLSATVSGEPGPPGGLPDPEGSGIRSAGWPGGVL